MLGEEGIELLQCGVHLPTIDDLVERPLERHRQALVIGVLGDRAGLAILDVFPGGLVLLTFEVDEGVRAEIPLPLYILLLEPGNDVLE